MNYEPSAIPVSGFISVQQIKEAIDPTVSKLVKEYFEVYSDEVKAQKKEIRDGLDSLEKRVDRSIARFLLPLLSVAALIALGIAGKTFYDTEKGFRDFQTTLSTKQKELEIASNTLAALTPQIAQLSQNVTAAQQTSVLVSLQTNVMQLAKDLAAARKDLADTKLRFSNVGPTQSKTDANK